MKLNNITGTKFRGEIFKQVITHNSIPRACLCLTLTSLRNPKAKILGSRYSASAGIVGTEFCLLA